MLHRVKMPTSQIPSKAISKESLRLLGDVDIVDVDEKLAVRPYYPIS